VNRWETGIDVTPRIRGEESEAWAKSSQIIYNENHWFVAQIRLYALVDNVLCGWNEHGACSG